MMIGILVEDCAVLVEGEPYMLDVRSDPPGFCILRDVQGKSHLVRESKIEDSGLKADVAWIHATQNSK